MRRLTALLLALTLGLTLGLAACSDGGDDESTDDTTDQTVDGGDTDGGDTDGGDTDGGDTDGGDGGDTDGPSVGGDTDEPSGDEQAYIDAMKASFEADAEEGMPLSDDEVDCLSKGYVDAIGVDRMKEAGIEPEAFDDESLNGLDLTEEDGEAIYAAFGDCDIDLREVMMEAMAADGSITPEQTECFDTLLTDEFVKRLIVEGMATGDGEASIDDPETAELMAPFMACAMAGFDTGDMTEIPAD